MARAQSVCNEPGCPETAAYRGKCRTHARAAERHARATVPTKRARARSNAERRKRADIVAAWRKRYGDWCPGYKRAPHRASDLTAEHVQALADGGAPAQPLIVLCRACNSRHGADTRNQRG